MTVQDVTVEQVGTSFRVRVDPLAAEFLFRDVAADGEMRADVTVAHDGRHLFRSTSTLSLAGRDRIAKTAAEMDSGDGEAWRHATFAAVERVLVAVEDMGAGADLRYAEAAGNATGMVIEDFWPAAATRLVMPREFGKSTFARTGCVSITSGREVIPGLKPRLTGPVLYVAAEDPTVAFHAKNVEEICRGAGIDRAAIPHPIELYDARGRSLHRIARNLTERAQDCAAVVLDSKQALEGAMVEGNIRDRDSLFWNAVDMIERPTLVLLHPNREDRRAWGRSDGSPAGSDVSGDRLRCLWKGVMTDDADPSIVASTRRYTLECRKWSHGPRFQPVSFALERRFIDGGWAFRFEHSDPVRQEDDGPRAGRPTTAYGETAAAYRAGARTPEALAKALGIGYDTARMRLNRYREQIEREAEA